MGQGSSWTGAAPGASCSDDAVVTQAGELVVDPFMGSGSAGVAAARLGRSFLGNDLNPAALDLAGPRLEQAGARSTERLYARARR